MSVFHLNTALPLEFCCCCDGECPWKNRSKQTNKNWSLSRVCFKALSPPSEIETCGSRKCKRVTLRGVVLVILDLFLLRGAFFPAIPWYVRERICRGWWSIYVGILSTSPCSLRRPFRSQYLRRVIEECFALICQPKAKHFQNRALCQANLNATVLSKFYRGSSTVSYPNLSVTRYAR